MCYGLRTSAKPLCTRSSAERGQMSALVVTGGRCLGEKCSVMAIAVDCRLSWLGSAFTDSCRRSIRFVHIASFALRHSSSDSSCQTAADTKTCRMFNQYITGRRSHLLTSRRYASSRRRRCDDRRAMAKFQVHSVNREVPSFCRYLNLLTSRSKTTCQNQLHPFRRFHRTPTCDRQTDRQTNVRP